MRALFDENTSASMGDAASRIAMNSSFKQRESLTIPLLTQETTEANADAIRAKETGAVVLGRFLRWHLDQQSLTLAVVVELNEAVETLFADLLPHHKPSRTYHVPLGSVAAIEAARRPEFLAAVESHFPIDPSMHFSVARLEVLLQPPRERELSAAHDVKMGKTPKAKHEHEQKKPAMKLNPTAVPSVPARGRRVVTVQQPSQSSKRQRRRQRPSQHLKWHRNSPVEQPAAGAQAAGTSTGHSAIDALIRGGGTHGRARAQMKMIQKAKPARRATSWMKELLARRAPHE